MYSSHCSKCNILQKMLDKKNINYEIISDENIYMQVAEKNNILSMPFANINNKIYNTKEFENYIMNFQEEINEK